MEEDDVRSAYMHAAEFWNERVEMMQVWADYLDQLRYGASVWLPFFGGQVDRSLGNFTHHSQGGPPFFGGHVDLRGGMGNPARQDSGRPSNSSQHRRIICDARCYFTDLVEVVCDARCIFTEPGLTPGKLMNARPRNRSCSPVPVASTTAATSNNENRLHYRVVSTCRFRPCVSTHATLALDSIAKEGCAKISLLDRYTRDES